MDIYKENGFENREDYLEFLADQYGMTVLEVLSIPGLVDALEDHEDFYEGREYR